MTRPADHAERRRAVEEHERNVFVVAGAGSGKTSLLVERVLHLVVAREIPLSRVAAITFTQAAAAELRERLGSAFAALAARASKRDAEAGGGEAARALARFDELAIDRKVVRARSLAALAQLDRAAVATLHAFCQRMLLRYPVESGVAPGFRADAGDERRRLVAERWPQVLSELARDDARGGALARVLERLELRDLEELFEECMKASVPIETWRRDGIPRAAVAAAARAWLTPWRERLAAYARRLPPGKRAKTFTARLQAVIAALDVFMERGAEGLGGALEARFEGKAEPGKDQRLAGDEADVALVGRAARFVDGLRAVDDRAFEDTVALLLEPATRVRAELARRGVLAFDDVLVRARDCLRDHAEVRRVEGERFQAILVDEFQDTDPIQYEIVLLLAAERASDGERDPWRARLAPGRLFVVGDPKQSIYRFRGADIAAFERALGRIAGEGGVRLSLRASFRSPAEILEPLDALFRGWLDARDDDERRALAAPEYEAIVAARTAPDARFGAGPRVVVATVAGAGGAAERRRAEAAWIAAEIAEGARAPVVRWSDHAILLPAFTEVSTYTRALHEHGVPFVLFGGKTFYERAEVGDLMAWLRAVAEPNDAVALLACLRSPAGAATDAELARYAESGGAWSASAPCDARAFPRVARAFETLRALRVEAGVAPSDAIVRRVLERTRLVEIHAAAYDGAQRVANLRRIEALAAALARERHLALDEIADELERGAREVPEREPALADESVDAVRVLTIHGAKGLEFAVVFAADLARDDGAETGAPTELDFDVHAGALRASARGAGRRTWSAAVATVERAAHDAAERRRLLYVAATRASERLYLIAARPRGRNARVDAIERAFGLDAAAPPADGAPLAGGTVLHRRIEGARPAPPIAARPVLDVVPPARAFESAARSASAAAQPPLVSPTGLREELVAREAEDDEAEKFPRRPGGRGASLARAVGVAVHALLARADFRDADATRKCTAATAIFERVASLERADAAAVESAARALLDRFAAGTLRRRLAGARIVARECPVLEARDGAATRGFVDLVFEESGELIVADWKTDALDDVSSEIDAAVARHRAQVVWYRDTLARASGRAVRAELFFLAIDRAVPLKG